mgnify:CR=1 FL=1
MPAGYGVGGYDGSGTQGGMDSGISASPGEAPENGGGFFSKILAEKNKDIIFYANKNISLSLQSGHNLGIIGESGSGKSTLVDILLGLLEPTSGHIIVDNTILCHNNINSWQNTVAYVPQTIYLTDDTLKNNIALGEIDEEINCEILATPGGAGAISSTMKNILILMQLCSIFFLNK